MAHETKGWTAMDLLLGGLLVVVGVVILGHTVIATALSLVFVGWLLFATGVIAVAASLFAIGKDGFWTALLGGGLLTVLGLVFLRHTAAAAVTVTLVAGSLFLVVGIARLAAAVEFPEQRVAMIIGGGVSLVLGLLVLFNLFTTSFTLLGVILGVQVLSEGIAIMVLGRESRRVGAAHRESDPLPAAPA